MELNYHTFLTIHSCIIHILYINTNSMCFTKAFDAVSESILKKTFLCRFREVQNSRKCIQFANVQPPRRMLKCKRLQEGRWGPWEGLTIFFKNPSSICIQEPHNPTPPPHTQDLTKIYFYILIQKKEKKEKLENVQDLNEMP